MRLHRRRQALARHVEKFLVELAHQHDRPFGEAGVFGEQRLVLDQFELGLLGERVRLLADRGERARRIEHHLCFFELLRSRRSP